MSDFIKNFILKNWKTTVAGAVAVLLVVAKTFGIDLPEDASETVNAFLLLLVGLFAKDANKTGPGDADPTAGELTPPPHDRS